MNVVRVTWSQLLYQRNQITGTLKVHIDRKVRQTLQNCKNCLSVLIEVILFQFLRRLHQNFDQTTLSHSLCVIKSR